MRTAGMLLLLLCALSACHTFTGVGQDVASVGNFMHDEASELRGEPVNPNAHMPAPDFTSDKEKKNDQ